MSPLLRERLALLATPANRSLLSECQHGIEKESLRISADGTLAQTPHPPALGSALTHPRITTDYSEALLELITDQRGDRRQRGPAVAVTGRDAVADAHL